MKNKIIAHLTIILILVGVFCNVCTTYNRLSVFDSSVYAEADNWSSCDTSDLVTAFRYYCKSRNLVVDSSIADALTSFTTTSFNNICSTLGIDLTTLQAELKKTTEGNLGLRFLFSQTGITAYNRIFAEFLQNNDLSVGDSVDNEVVYSAKTFTDADGNSCLVYYVNDYPTSYLPASAIQKWGTPYKYTNSELVSLIGGYSNSANSINLTFNLTDNVSKTCNLIKKTWSNGIYGCLNGSGTIQFIKSVGNYHTPYVNNTYAIIYDTYHNKLYFGGFGATLGDEKPATMYGYDVQEYYDLTNKGSVDDTDVTVNTPNNTVINNNTYNNNTYVIIYNDGDTYITDDDDEPLPTTPPSGGGGGGGNDNPDNPDNPDIPPVDPTPTPNPTIPDWDIELPEMPTGNDWLLYGLEKKFPWDIPFNLMYMLSLFAADPETPHFEGTLDLKIVQWNYDIDLAPFDDIAGYVRNIEFIGFLIGLMLLTNKLIWG